MSGTRLLSRKAPATENAAEPALLIVAHGERGGSGNDRFVHDICARLQRDPRYRTVQACFISKEPSLKNVYDRLPAGPVIICPLFMSDGYFVKNSIPASIKPNQESQDGAARKTRVLAPVGMNPRLPLLVAGIAKVTAETSGGSASDCRLLLVAHGSKHDHASRDATHSVAAAIEKASGFAGVSLAFLEESPFLQDQLRNIDGPAVAVGLFIGEGMHGAEDLPDAVQKSGRDDILLSTPLAQWPGLADLICDDLRTQRSESN